LCSDCPTVARLIKATANAAQMGFSQSMESAMPYASTTARAVLKASRNRGEGKRGASTVGLVVSETRLVQALSIDDERRLGRAWLLLGRRCLTGLPK
jgi:hypothetical protein